MRETSTPATRRRHTEALAIGVALVAVLAACGGGGTASSLSSSASVASTTASQTAPPASAAPTASLPSAGQADFTLGTAAVKVGIGNGDDPNGARFEPVAVTVHVGDIVEWDNSPAAPIKHNIVFADQESLSNRVGLGSKANGDPGSATWQVRFAVPGVYGYRCTFHAGMTASVTVG